MASVSRGSPFQIAHGQSVEQDQQAEADHLRHTGQHISDKQGIQAEQYRQDPQLFPGGLHQPDKYKHGDCQQHDIADHGDSRFQPNNSPHRIREIPAPDSMLQRTTATHDFR